MFTYLSPAQHQQLPIRSHHRHITIVKQLSPTRVYVSARSMRSVV